MLSADHVIRTARLELTPLRAQDATEMAQVLGDERLHEFTGGSPDTPDQLRGRFARLAAGSGQPGETWLNWIVRLHGTGSVPGTGRAVGTVQATVTGSEADASASVAWVIGVRWQGRGFASEAAAALVAWLAGAGASTVTASIAPGHAASERVAARAGMAPTRRMADGERIWAVAAARAAPRS